MDRLFAELFLFAFTTNVIHHVNCTK